MMDGKICGQVTSALNYSKLLFLGIALLALVAGLFPPFALMGEGTSAFVANFASMALSIIATLSILTWWGKLNYSEKTDDVNWADYCLKNEGTSKFYAYGGIIFGILLVCLALATVFTPLLTHGAMIPGVGGLISSSAMLEAPAIITAFMLAISGIFIALRSINCAIIRNGVLTDPNYEELKTDKKLSYFADRHLVDEVTQTPQEIHKAAERKQNYEQAARKREHHEALASLLHQRRGSGEQTAAGDEDSFGSTRSL